MRDGKIRIALREFRAGMWRAFDAEELRVIGQAIDDALDSLARQSEGVHAKVVTARALEVMGPGWTSCAQWYLDRGDKLDAADSIDGVWSALVTMATFVPLHSHVRHLFSHVDEEGRVHSVCKVFKSTGPDQVKKTLGTNTADRRGFRRIWVRHGWCRHCARNWFPYDTSRWLPPQSESAMNWQPRVKDDVKEDPLEDTSLDPLTEEISSECAGLLSDEIDQ